MQKHSRPPGLSRERREIKLNLQLRGILRSNSLLTPRERERGLNYLRHVGLARILSVFQICLGILIFYYTSLLHIVDLSLMISNIRTVLIIIPVICVCTLINLPKSMLQMIKEPADERKSEESAQF